MQFRKNFLALFFIVVAGIFLQTFHFPGPTKAYSSPAQAQHDPGQEAEVKDTPLNSENDDDIDNSETFASLNEFPNLHPMVVHFPIVLLLIAFISQLIGLFVMKKELSWVTLVVLFLGVLGGWIAAKYAHAHPHDLPGRISQIFEEHEWYANVTLWISGVTFLLKLFSHFWIKNNRWLEIIVTVTLFLSATTVSLTGHLGSQLVHIENVGPQGNYLEEEHEH